MRTPSNMTTGRKGESRGVDLLEDRATDDQLTERDIATLVEMRHDTHIKNDGNEHMARFT